MDSFGRSGLHFSAYYFFRKRTFSGEVGAHS